MAKKIYITATDQNAGKTTTSLALLQLARQRGLKVGFVKPVGPKPIPFAGRMIDTDAVTVAQVFGLEEQLDLMCPVVVEPGMTQQVINGAIDPAELERRVVQAVERLDRECDVLILEGAGHSGVGSVIGLSNARIAALVEAPVLMVTGGGVGSVVDAVCMNLALYRECGAEVRLLVANKLDPERREKTLESLRKAFARERFDVIGGFNYQPVLANPTLKRIAAVLKAQVHGRTDELMRIIHHVKIGASSTQRVVDMLQPNSLILVNGSRDELLVTLANLYNLPEYHPLIVGVVIPGISQISTVTRKILEDSGLPCLRVSKSTSDAFLAIHDDVSKLTAEDAEKIAMIRDLGPKRFDFDEIERRFF